MNHSPLFRKLAWFTVLATFVLVMLGAYVRLSHAGLGCPDWPVCYGKLTWPDAPAEIAAANAEFERPVEVPKAWKEQIHRHLAAIVGLLILILAAGLNQGRLRAVALVAAALGAVGTVLYVMKYASLAAALSVPAVALPMLVGLFRRTGSTPRRLSLFLLGLVTFQAMLGMWTVTWQLLPLVVTAHLLGGMATLALLVWLALSLGPEKPRLPIGKTAVAGGTILLVVQIFLGGWTSTNYAALACPDFPQCNKALADPWWPDIMDFAEGFKLFREIGVDYEGGILDAGSRKSIHMTHRIGAVIVAGYLLVLGVLLIRRRQIGFGAGLLTVLTVQILLGIANIVWRLPLPVAVLHNGVAALLLIKLVMLLRRAE